jgi:hypothetical protein
LFIHSYFVSAISLFCSVIFYFYHSFNFYYSDSAIFFATMTQLFLDSARYF